MIDILYTRLLLWKRRPISLLFWLLVPAIGTYLFISVASTIQEDSKVPIAIVNKDHSTLSNELIVDLKASDLVHIYELEEREALHELKQHDLDSVFIIEEGFEDNILKGRRNNILTSYRTELSFAYSPIKETIVSLVQEKSGRAKVAIFLQNEYETTIPFQEIIERSKQIQVSENLLTTTFVYSNSVNREEKPSLITWDTWGIWAILSLLSTLFLTDWVIREKALSVSTRLSFITMSRLSYYGRTISLYLLLFFLADLISLAIFSVFLEEAISIRFMLALISYRIMITLQAFSIAQCFKRVPVYYFFSLLLTFILAIIGGVIIPFKGFIPNHPILEFINPMHAFLSSEVTLLWLCVSVLLVTFSLVRKEISNA